MAWLLFAVQHIVQQQLVHLKVNISTELKKWQPCPPLPGDRVTDAAGNWKVSVINSFLVTIQHATLVVMITHPVVVKELRKTLKRTSESLGTTLKLN